MKNYSPSSGYPIFVRVIHICTSHLMQFLSAHLRWRWGANSCKRITRFFSPLISPQMNFKWFSVRNRFHNFIFRGGFCFRPVKMFMLYLENCIGVKEIHHRSIKIIFTRPPFKLIIFQRQANTFFNIAGFQIWLNILIFNSPTGAEWSCLFKTGKVAVCSSFPQSCHSLGWSWSNFCLLSTGDSQIILTFCKKWVMGIYLPLLDCVNCFSVLVTKRVCGFSSNC